MDMDMADMDMMLHTMTHPMVPRGRTLLEMQFFSCRDVSDVTKRSRLAALFQVSIDLPNLWIWWIWWGSSSWHSGCGLCGFYIATLLHDIFSQKKVQHSMSLSLKTFLAFGKSTATMIHWYSLPCQLTKEQKYQMKQAKRAKKLEEASVDTKLWLRNGELPQGLYPTHRNSNEQKRWQQSYFCTFDKGLRSWDSSWTMPVLRWTVCKVEGEATAPSSTLFASTLSSV